MSVIPFDKNGSVVSYTSKRRDFSLDGNVVAIQNIDESQLAPDSSDGNATYNLRFGHRYRDYNDSDVTGVEIGDKIYIAPGKTIVIETLEFVHFPVSRYGLILPRVSLLQRGLSTVASKVDPGYHGHLAITLFNHSRDTESVTCGEQFCSLTLLEVASPSRPYDKVSKTLSGSKKGILKKARDYYYRNLGIITFINTFIILVTISLRFTGIYNWIISFI